MAARNKKHLPGFVLLWLALGVPGLTILAGAQRFRNPAEDPAELRARVQSYRKAHELQILNNLKQFLSLPNNAMNLGDIRKNAAALIAMLKARGARTQLLEVAGAPPGVFGEIEAPGATYTVGFYAHYDGQTVVPSQWASGPYTPVIRARSLEEGGKIVPWDDLKAPVAGEDRIYARSSSDDKSPIIALMTALDALRSNSIAVTFNVKFFFEGEEEAGSPHLVQILSRYRQLLPADAWLFCDGPVHQSGKKQVVYGARGVMGLKMTVYGADRRLHSGHYGNWAPNPNIVLAQLLSSMRDTDSRILIKGFYDDVRPLSAEDKEALTELPSYDDTLRRELGLAWTEGQGHSLMEQILRPGLNVTGMQGGQVGSRTKNAIPTQARASIDFRLVPDQTPERVRRLVEAHIAGQGFFIVHQEPTLQVRLAHPHLIWLDWEQGYPAFRTRLGLPMSRAVFQVVSEATGQPTLRVPGLGGSLPASEFSRVVKSPLIVVPMVNYDNNQHAPNENLRIQNLWDGIDAYAGLMGRLGLVLRGMEKKR